MANFLLVEPSRSDSIMDAYITSHETALGPISNLFLRQPKEIWETQNVTGTIEARFDVRPGTTYDFFALLFTNATDAATITWSGSTVTSFGSIAWTSGSMPLVKPGQGTRERRHHFYLKPTSASDRYVRFQISDPTNPDGVFRAGRIYLCKAYRPSLNIAYGLGFGYSEDPVTIVTSAGEEITRPLETKPSLRFKMQSWGSTAEAEFYANLLEIMRISGSSRDVIAIVDPEHATLSGAMLYYGRLQNNQMIELPNNNFYEANFELRGLI